MKKSITLLLLISYLTGYSQSSFCEGWMDAVSSEGFGGTTMFPCIGSSGTICSQYESQYTCGFKTALKEINVYKNAKTEDDVINEINERALKSTVDNDHRIFEHGSIDEYQIDPNPTSDSKIEANPNLVLPDLNFGSRYLNSLTKEQKEAIRERNSERVSNRRFRGRGSKIDHWRYGKNRLLEIQINLAPIDNEVLTDHTYSTVRSIGYSSLLIHLRVTEHFKLGLGISDQRRYFKRGPVQQSTSITPLIMASYEIRKDYKYVSINIQGNTPFISSPFNWVSGNYLDYDNYIIGDTDFSVSYGYIISYPHSFFLRTGLNGMYYQSPITYSVQTPDPTSGIGFAPYFGIGYKYILPI